ncbi:MAG: translation elongation factor Ts [Deltaproteobacteria bacterium]|nr:translation elongation factor Ts [Deltaproteobacteria bacterium]
MADITAQLVKELRERTGVGMMDCKNALEETKGDMDAAIENLRKKGLKTLGKRMDREAKEGLIYSYLHPNSRVGVLVELNCETDFVARGDDFRETAKGIAMHVAWANPRFLDREQVPAATIESETALFRSQLTPQQEKVADKIVSAKLEKFFEDNCLVEQVDMRDGAGKKIGDLVTGLAGRTGERIILRRFKRFELGESLS